MGTSRRGLLTGAVAYAALGSGASAAEMQGDRPDAVIDLGSRLELLIDRYLVASSKGVELRLQQPTPREVAIVHDAPWEGNASGYHTVLKDGDRYRMYYRGHRYVVDGSPLRQAQPEVICYAESTDGIHWTKPELGLIEWQGSRRNNIINRDEGTTHNFCPFLDTRPGCPEAERFKAVGGTVRTGLLAYRSADGIHWSRMQEGPVFKDGAFDSQNVVFWDPTRGRYALYFRYFSKGNFEGLRSIGVSYSDDFRAWTAARPLSYGDSPPQQMYTNQVHPYARAPHLLFGFPTRYVAREPTSFSQGLDPVELRDRLSRALKRAGSDLTDGLFMTSRDGIRFHRWDEAFVRPGPQAEGRWIYGDNYQSLGLVETRSAATGAPSELSFYMSEGAWRDAEVRERRYTVRLDGFVAAHAPYAGGELTTRPLRFAGSRLVVNYATSAAGSLRVEVQDAVGKPIPGFELDRSTEQFGDSVEQAISWTAGADLSKLAGTPVRLRFLLRDADLFAFRFRSGAG